MGISLQNYFYFFRVNHFSRIITNDSAYIKYEISTLVWSLLDYRLQFMRYAMKALRCNGFVDGPVSLQLTGHPFAKPHVPCVVASQLCFVHERASTSSCWSVKFLCKHEICPDLTWRVNCNTFYQFSEFFQKKCWQINIHMIVYRSRLQKLTNIKGYSSMVEQRSPKP